MTILRDVPLRSVPVAEPETALSEALQMLSEDPLHTVVLVGDETFMGIFDEAARDSGGIPADVDPATLAVGPYANRPRIVGRPEMGVADVLEALRRRGQEVLPVVDNNTFMGVVTRADLEGLSSRD